MTYPEGNLIARNLVQRPKFDSTQKAEGWDARYYLSSLRKTMPVSLNVEPREWAGGRYRLGTSNTETNGFLRVRLPKDVLTRGVVVNVEYFCGAKSGPMDVGLIPIFDTSSASDPGGERFTYMDRAKSGSWATPLPAGGAELRVGTTVVPALPPKWYVEDTVNGGVSRWFVENAVGAHLVFAPPADTNISSTSIVTVRADYYPTTVSGYFDGDTPNTSTVAYSWAAGSLPSQSLARTTVATEPEPPVIEEPSEPPVPEEPSEPEVPVIPEPVDPEETHPLARRLVAYVGRPGDTEALALANAQLPIVEAFVHGYVRGRGFYVDGTPTPPLQAVIISAAARLLSNPEQVTWYAIGDYSERPRVLEGYTLAEIGVLHRYRKRAA